MSDMACRQQARVLIITQSQPASQLPVQQHCTHVLGARQQQCMVVVQPTVVAKWDNVIIALHVIAWHGIESRQHVCVEIGSGSECDAAARHRYMYCAE